MTKVDDTFSSLNELLGINAEEKQEMISVDDDKNVQSLVPQDNTVIAFRENTNAPDKGQSATDDFNFAREVIHDALQRAQDLVAVTIREAKITGHPMVMQAANQAIKNISELGKDLLEIHNKIKELKADDKPQQPGKTIIVEKSTLELLRELKKDMAIIDGEATRIEHNGSESRTTSS
jgi:lipopolysaccharide biosynthesis regulator YciM